jgi:uncharacterized protein YdeI (YjbR/CyaY-like superfamily)
LNTASPSPSFYAPDLTTWRRWLKAHHSTERVVWLVFRKSKSKVKCISYDDALDEALCWGWIDSIVRRIDDNTYARKFTRRINAAKWSAVNLNRLKRLQDDKRVQPAGREAVSDENMQQVLGLGPKERSASPALSVPKELDQALEASSQARSFFETLAPSYRRNYVGWVSAAKQTETRKRRAQEVVSLLSAGQKAVLK